MVLPNLFNAVGALFRWIRAVLRHEPTLVSEEVLAERLGTCETCDFLDPETRQCKSCTCFVDLKANLSTETCPEKKWKE